MLQHYCKSRFQTVSFLATTNRASEYTSTYSYTYNANLKRLEESVVNIGGAVSPIPIAIAVPIPVGVPMFFGGGPFSTLEQAVK